MTGPEKASFWLRELYNGVNLYSRFTEIKVVIYMYTSGYTWNSGELSYLSILFYMWECLRVSNPFLKRGNIQLKCVNVQLFKLIVSSSLFEEREVSLFMKYHNWLSYCIKDRKSDKWKIPRCSYTFKLLEYTWTFPVTDLHFPPCDVVSGFWQWVSDTLGKLQGQGGGVKIYLCLMLLTMPTLRALSFLLMSGAIGQQSTERQSQIMAQIQIKQWFLL